MAKIVINEISQNYTWNIGTSSYATVALPITSCWGPGYFDPKAEYGGENYSSSNVGAMLEHTAWMRFPATQAGLDSFVSTYRGASECYRLAKDNSYQIAMTLLTAGYDILTCRICPGSKAGASFSVLPENDTDTDTDTDTEDPSTNYTVTLQAKYPGSFGNTIQIQVRKMSYVGKPYWNFITYIVDANGVRTSAENISLVFDSSNATDTIPYYEDITSKFWNITKVGSSVDDSNSCVAPINMVTFANGSDYDSTAIKGTDSTDTFKTKLKNIIEPRFVWANWYTSGSSEPSADAYSYYYTNVTNYASTQNLTMKNIHYYQEWIRTHLVGYNFQDSDGDKLGGVFDILKDKLSYNPNRIISPGWDDQDMYMYTDDETDIATWTAQSGASTCMVQPSPLHLKLMDVAYYSRCATGFIDVPKIVERRFVHIENPTTNDMGYIQELARVVPANAALDINGSLFQTHCGFFAPWGQYTFVGTRKMTEASPSFLALMIQRAQILNQAIQYEWALPTNRKHNLRIGKMQYSVPKKVLDKWQKLDGASVNVITAIPDLGTNIWGNSTLFEVPPATYQALANLSTRFLVNAVEDVVYRCGTAITFQYNNDDAYSSFYAGVTPLLDTMRNVGAIEDYRVTMSADINGEDYVNANTVIGKIWLVVNGVINDIYVDLVALPAGAGIDLASLS